MRGTEAHRVMTWLVNVTFTVKNDPALNAQHSKNSTDVPSALQFCVVVMEKAILKNTLNNSNLTSV